MRPISFREQNRLYAKDQPPYRPLPAHLDEGGGVTSCWRLTWRERLKVIITGRVWLTLLTFGRAVQPQLLSVDHPWRAK